MSQIRSIIYIAKFFLFLVIKNGNSAAVSNVTTAIDRDISIYYDPIENTKFPIETSDASRLPLYPIKIISKGSPCSCENLRCGCCTGINITMIKFDRIACANITVLPEEFAMDLHVFMDDDEIMTNRLTARNPPAACVPLYFLPIVSFCVRFFDLHLKDDKLNACIDFETRIAQFPMFVLHFNCLKFGVDSDGGSVVWVTPPSESSVDFNVEPIVANIMEPEIWDSVNFEITDENAPYLHTSTLTPEEEAQIGTLKI